jgi:hypothetical protein
MWAVDPAGQTGPSAPLASWNTAVRVGFMVSGVCWFLFLILSGLCPLTPLPAHTAAELI